MQGPFLCLFKILLIIHHGFFFALIFIAENCVIIFLLLLECFGTTVLPVVPVLEEGTGAGDTGGHIWGACRGRAGHGHMDESSGGGWGAGRTHPGLGLVPLEVVSGWWNIPRAAA